jgi:hemerythrin superfamily protein
MASSTSKSSVKGQDAIALLTADHKAVKAMFKEFEKLMEQDDADEEKAALVEQICNELTIHAQVEEEIFYPAVREAIEDDDLMDEADVEHASAKDLIAQLEGMSPGDDHYDAKVTVLGEYIDHHVKEEEGEMFTKARKADVDTDALGQEIAGRKAELKTEMGIDDDEAVAPAVAKRAVENGAKKARTPARK